MIHVGVALHQRFRYMTAMETRGKIMQGGRSRMKSWLCDGFSAVSGETGAGGGGGVRVLAGVSGGGGAGGGEAGAGCIRSG